MPAAMGSISRVSHQETFPFVGASTGAARIELNHPGKRAELSGIHSGSRVAVPDGCFEPVNAHHWYVFSIYLEDWADDAVPDIVTQWHHHWCLRGLASASPPLAIGTCQGEWTVTVPQSSEWAKWNPANSTTNTISYCVGPHGQTTWTHWLVHVKWSVGADGLVEIWKWSPTAGNLPRPDLVYCAHGKNTYDHTYDLGTGNYIKFGIYKWSWPQIQQTPPVSTRVLHFDNLRIVDGVQHAGNQLPSGLNPLRLTTPNNPVTGRPCC